MIVKKPKSSSAITEFVKFIEKVNASSDEQEPHKKSLPSTSVILVDKKK